MSRALLVFAKTPISGTVKTRLSAVLGPDGAQELYSAFVRDIAAGLASLDESDGPEMLIRWHVAPDPEPLREVIGVGELRDQTGTSLGERMRAAFEDAAADKYDSVVIIGTDTPTLSPDVIRQAFDLLTGPGQAVLGPALDGGYYLLGLRGVDPGFLDTITYSRSDVLERTAESLTSAGHQIAYLPELFDVDRPEDLSRLQSMLEENPSLALHTAHFLRHSFASGGQS